MVSFKELSLAGAAVLAVAPQAFAAPLQAYHDHGLPTIPKNHLIHVARSIVDGAPAETLERWTRDEAQASEFVHALARAISDDEEVAELVARGFLSKFVHKNKELDKSKYPAQSNKPEKGLPAMPSRKQAEAGVRYSAPSNRARPIPKKAKTMRRGLEDGDMDLETRGFLSKYVHKNKELDKSKYPAQSTKPEKGLPAMPSRKQAEAGVRYTAPSKSTSGGGRARPIPKKAKTMRRDIEDAEMDLEARGFLSKYVHKNKGLDKSNYPAQSKKPEKGLPAMPSRKQAEAGVRYTAPSRSSSSGGRARPVPKKAKTI